MRKSLGLALLLVTGTGGPVFAQETGAGGGGPLTVDGGLVIWTLVVFGLLLYVLKRNAWPGLLAAAKGEAQEILNKAKTVAEKERATLLAKAREEYERLLTRARKEIDEEKEKALLALRQEAVDLSIAAAAKLLDANLDTEANRRLVTEYLAGLELAR